MALAALIVSIVANLTGAWSVNHQRLLYRWTRDRYKAAMPKLWHLRYHRSTEPVVLKPTLHINVTNQADAVLEAMRREIQRGIVRWPR